MINDFQSIVVVLDGNYDFDIQGKKASSCIWRNGCNPSVREQHAFAGLGDIASCD